MLETHFASSTGSSENISTANDVFVLLRHMLENKTFLINATMKDAHSISDEDGKEKFHWENVFVKQASTTQYRGGLLTMEEQSGEAALLFSLPLEEFGERKIAFIVLDSRDPKADIEMMKDFVEQHFVYAPTTRSFATVVAEENEPTPSLWGKIRALWKLDFLLRQG
jgi:D-alanyl-D-alanine carboxypeptidase